MKKFKVLARGKVQLLTCTPWGQYVGTWDLFSYDAVNGLDTAAAELKSRNIGAMITLKGICEAVRFLLEQHIFVLLQFEAGQSSY